MGQFDFAGGLLDGSSIGTLFIAEQFTFQQRFRDCRAINSHEALFPSGARLVERPRQYLLAGAALTQENHGRIGRRNLLDIAAYLQQYGIASYYTGDKRVR